MNILIVNVFFDWWIFIYEQSFGWSFLLSEWLLVWSCFSCAFLLSELFSLIVR